MKNKFLGEMKHYTIDFGSIRFILRFFNLIKLLLNVTHLSKPRMPYNYQ
jgi:hypothetical protein